MAEMGLSSMEELFDSIPGELRASGLEVGESLSEMEVGNHLARLAGVERGRTDLLYRSRFLRSFHPGRGGRPDQPGGVLHRLYPLPGRDVPGDPPIHL